MTSEVRAERIRQRAYELWEQAGRPEGRQAEHWDQAEREVHAQETQTDEEAAEATITSPQPVRPAEQGESQAEAALEAANEVSRRKKRS